MHLLAGKTHTSFLLEDPMKGGTDLLCDLVMGVVNGKDAGAGVGVGVGGQHAPSYPSLCPDVLCRLASWVCPF